MKRIMAAIISVMLLLTGCSAAHDDAQNAQPLRRQELLMDTVVEITIYEGGSETMLDGAFALCREYEALFSRTIDASDISRINAAHGAPVEVSDDTVSLLEGALSYSRLSDGAFDPTIEPLVSLWNINSDAPHVPDADEIQRALTRVDWTQVRVSENTVTLPDGMGLDLGGIAKGYIADRLREYLHEQGARSAIINLGGNVLTLGSKPGGVPFTIGARKPFAQSQGEIIGACRVSDKSIVTSGVYERYFEQDGRLYHHILDTATGYPVDNGVYSVTIISQSSMDGDALSTICLALGQARGLELIESLDGVEAIYFMADGSYALSSGADEYWLYPDEL